MVDTEMTATPTRQPEALRLVNEYRPTMPHDVLNSWAQDAKVMIARLTAENEALRVKMELVDYVLQDDIYNRLTPRVVDITYSAFASGRGGRNEAREPCDWFNDTKPRVVVWLDKIKKDLTEEAAHGIGEKP